MIMRVDAHFLFTLLKPFPWATGEGEKKKVLTKSNLIQIAFAPKEETLKPFRKNKLTVISFV